MPIIILRSIAVLGTGGTASVRGQDEDTISFAALTVSPSRVENTEYLLGPWYAPKLAVSRACKRFSRAQYSHIQTSTTVLLLHSDAQGGRPRLSHRADDVSLAPGIGFPGDCVRNTARRV